MEESGALDTAIGILNTTVVIVKEVGEMLRNAPYVNSVDGIILQIVRIKDVRPAYLLSHVSSF